MLLLVVGISVGTVHALGSRNSEDQGVPQVTLEYGEYGEDDYESTIASERHYAYDAYDGTTTAGASQYGSTGVAPDGEHNEEMYAHQETRVYDKTDDFTISTEEERGVEVEVDEPESTRDDEVVEVAEAAEIYLSNEPGESRTEAVAQGSPTQQDTTEADSVDSNDDSYAARQAALKRRASEAAEVAAAELAEKGRRVTGAPVETEAPATIHDYYKPPVLDPVYVGGYYKRANPWDTGRRSSDE